MSNVLLVVVLIKGVDFIFHLHVFSEDVLKLFVLFSDLLVLGGVPSSGFSENFELFNPEKRHTPSSTFQKER